MTNNLEDDIKAIVSGMDNQENKDSTEPPQQEIQDVYLLIVRETEALAEDQSKVVESIPAPVRTQQDSFLSAYMFVCFSLFLILSMLTFQLYCVCNPPIATITIIPKSQQLTLNGTLQIGRLLSPITISQAQTVATTGRGHQDARNAVGAITFYNGQLTSIFVPAGTILTGADGTAISTDQDASIPASNLPQVGQVTVSAHAISPGSKGNIAALDINLGCCATAVKAVNTSSFYGGQDERSYQVVTKADITNAAIPLTATVNQSMQGALQGQLKTNEQLSILPCRPIISSNRNIGDEAIQVKVTVSETCSAVAYSTTALQTKATQLLTTQAYQKLGTGYSLLGDIQIKVIQPSVTNTSPHLVFLSFKASGTYLYGLSRQWQEHLMELIAGKPKDQALNMLSAIPEVKQASIRLDGFTDGTRLPKNSTYIHLILRVS
jgi:hypothetical protein